MKVTFQIKTQILDKLSIDSNHCNSFQLILLLIMCSQKSHGVSLWNAENFCLQEVQADGQKEMEIIIIQLQNVP